MAERKHHACVAKAALVLGQDPDTLVVDVLSAPYDFAWQVSLGCAAMRDVGVGCVSMDWDPHPFGPKVDLHLNQEPAGCFEALARHTNAFLFHEYAPEGFFTVPRLQRRGKCVMVMTHGSEFRPVDKWAERNKAHMPPGLNRTVALKEFVGMPDSDVAFKLEFLHEFATAVLAPDGELLSYHPDMYHPERIPRVINASQYRRAPPRDLTMSGPIRIVHAPSQLEVKGTRYVRAAIESLKMRHKIDFVELHGIPHTEVVQELERADIVVDQLVLGWYGVLTTEALAMGKPVVVHVAADVRPPKRNGFDVMAYADVFSVETTLDALIADATLRNGIAEAGHEYVMEEHDIKRSIPRMLSLFDRVCGTGTQLSAMARLRAFLSEHHERPPSAALLRRLAVDTGVGDLGTVG